MPGSTPAVSLVSMPWTSLSEASLGLGILKAKLAERGIPARVRHLNLLLLRHLTSKTYLDVANMPPVNDFLFTYVLDPELSARQWARLRKRVDDAVSGRSPSLRAYQDADALTDVLLRMRNEVVPRYLADCADLVAADAPTLVGFTCMFDQTIASVALAKLLRERCPDALLVLGGYAVGGATGATVLRAFPWIDAVAEGDGEDVIGPLAEASLDRTRLGLVPGLRFRERPAGPPTLTAVRPAVPAALDRSPVPAYDDFFADVRELADRDQVVVRVDTLPVETSRGCWWGAVSHCVFCGIDDETLKYRAKSPDRVLEVFAELAARHGLRTFRIADYILPQSYFRTLLPRLAEVDPPYRLSCEMKANASEQMFAALQAAGFTEVQAGIESFSTPVLKRMAKGVRAIQNVHTLLLGRRFGIEVHYNVIYGFPGDEPAEYDELLALLPRLFHLTPPVSRMAVQITRHAPLQTEPERFGIPVRPTHDPSYELLFSPEYTDRTGFDYDDYCYYYKPVRRVSPELRARFDRLVELVDEWQRLHREHEARLAWCHVDGGIRFEDLRRPDLPRVVELGAGHASVYPHCAREPLTVDQLADATGLPVARVSEIVSDLDDAGLVMREGQRVLGLALATEVYATPLPTGARRWVGAQG